MNHLLLPLEGIYRCGVFLHQWCYFSGLRKVCRLTKPVISVGNLTMGGTGKTPTVIALGRLLAAEGLSVSVLLRGYRGTRHKEPLLVCDGSRILSNSASAGDESLVIARNLPKAIVAVGRNRAQVGRWVEDNFTVDVHLLDDGFQHYGLHRDLDLLLIDVTNPFGGGHLPPLGRLREPLAGIARAHAILLTRAWQGMDYRALLEKVRPFHPQIPCLNVRQQLALVNPADSTTPGHTPSLNGLKGIAMAGIGHPGQFFDALRSEGVLLVGTVPFPDHHRYSKEDLQQVAIRCRQHGVETVFTTEKDAENLQGLDPGPLKLLVVKVHFEFEDLHNLHKLLEGVLGHRVTQAGPVVKQSLKENAPGQ